jgi:hypothetical protein
LLWFIRCSRSAPGLIRGSDYLQANLAKAVPSAANRSDFVHRQERPTATDGGRRRYVILLRGLAGKRNNHSRQHSGHVRQHRQEIVVRKICTGRGPRIPSHSIARRLKWACGPRPCPSPRPECAAARLRGAGVCGISAVAKRGSSRPTRSDHCSPASLFTGRR